MFRPNPFNTCRQPNSTLSLRPAGEREGPGMWLWRGDRERTRELAGRRPPPGRTATGVADRSTRAATPQRPHRADGADRASGTWRSRVHGLDFGIWWSERSRDVARNETAFSRTGHFHRLEQSSDSDACVFMVQKFCKHHFVSWLVVDTGLVYKRKILLIGWNQLSEQNRVHESS